MRVLFVCLGNICRSPMAEGAFRARLRQAGLDKVASHDSVGTGDWHVGDPPDARSIACAKRHGVDISDLRARQLCARDFEDFDLLLCADHANLRAARAMAPEGMAGKCQLLAAYAGEGEDAIPDPYTGGEQDFDQVWAMVDRMADAVVARLSERDPAA